MNIQSVKSFSLTSFSSLKKAEAKNEKRIEISTSNSNKMIESLAFLGTNAAALIKFTGVEKTSAIESGTDEMSKHPDLFGKIRIASTRRADGSTAFYRLLKERNENGAPYRLKDSTNITEATADLTDIRQVREKEKENVAIIGKMSNGNYRVVTVKDGAISIIREYEKPTDKYPKVVFVYNKKGIPLLTSFSDVGKFEIDGALKDYSGLSFGVEEEVEHLPEITEGKSVEASKQTDITRKDAISKLNEIIESYRKTTGIFDEDFRVVSFECLKETLGKNSITEQDSASPLEYTYGYISNGNKRTIAREKDGRIVSVVDSSDKYDSRIQFSFDENGKLSSILGSNKNYEYKDPIILQMANGSVQVLKFSEFPTIFNQEDGIKLF